MKIINISQSFEIKGGSDTYFKALSTLLSEHGIDVAEFASSGENSSIYPRAINFEKPTLTDIIKYFYNLDAKKKLETFISNNKFDIAHLHIYYGKLTSSILKPLKEQGIPIVQTLHEYKIVCPTYKLYDGNNLCLDCADNNFYKAIFKKCNRNSFSKTFVSAAESYISLWAGSQRLIDKFITVSEFQKRQIIEMGFMPGKITTIHNFIDVSSYPNFHQDGDYVLYFGRIEKVKGIDSLLEAFEILPPTIKLVIVGHGEYESEVRARISSSKKLYDRVKLLGFMSKDELSQTIHKSKFVIVPSIWYETFGLTVVEAMAHYKPVIGANIGGITEIISHEIDGLLFEPGDFAELSKHIRYLWNDDSLVKNMGYAARKKVETEFSPKIHFEKLNTIYKSLI
jgi:glycosyltransferase involved in cell wall biosynthesis